MESGGKHVDNAEENSQSGSQGEDLNASEQGGPSEDVTLSRQDYEALNGRLLELENMRDKLMRSAADFENAKKRLGREREEFVKFGQESLLRNLLPILDNFERAIAHAASPSDASDDSPAARQFKNVISGVQMVQKQLTDILKSQGLTRIKSLGEKFDPHKHEALSYVEEDGAEDEVVAEIEPGYMLHDRLLRAAKVNVRTNPKASSPGQS